LPICNLISCRNCREIKFQIIVVDRQTKNKFVIIVLRRDYLFFDTIWILVNKVWKRVSSLKKVRRLLASSYLLHGQTDRETDRQRGLWSVGRMVGVDRICRNRSINLCCESPSCDIEELEICNVKQLELAIINFRARAEQCCRRKEVFRSGNYVQNYVHVSHIKGVGGRAVFAILALPLSWFLVSFPGSRGTDFARRVTCSKFIDIAVDKMLPRDCFPQSFLPYSVGSIRCILVIDILMRYFLIIHTLLSFSKMICDIILVLC